MSFILWYVHHHGAGHWRRAIAVASHLEVPVVFASSRPPIGVLPDHCDYLPLPLDTSGAASCPTARGRLHWAPLHDSGLHERHLLLLRAAAGASLAVVDVSVEVTVLLRVSGVPVIAVRLPGVRADPPHTLGFDLANRVVMPVPASWDLHSSGRETTAVGLISAIRHPRTDRWDERGPVVVVLGQGGDSLTEESLRSLKVAANNGLLLARHRCDVHNLLAAASVVVGATGLGTVADVARVQRPFIGIPAVRPFDEQVTTANALAARESAVVLPIAPTDVAGWQDVLRAAVSAGPLRADTGGAAAMAALIAADL